MPRTTSRKTGAAEATEETAPTNETTTDTDAGLSAPAPSRSRRPAAARTSRRGTGRTVAAVAAAEAGEAHVEQPSPTGDSVTTPAPEPAVTAELTASVAEPSADAPRRSRTRGRRPGTATQELAVGMGEVAPLMAGEDAGAVAPVAAVAPTSTANPWAPTRRFEVGPDGRVRFLDSASTPVTTGPQSPETGSPSATPEPEQAVAETQAMDEADEATAPAARPAGRRRGGRTGRGGHGEPASAAAEAARAESTFDIISRPASVDQEGREDQEDQEAVEELTASEIDTAIAEGEGMPDGATEAQRRRRRSRRGGRGRRRNGTAADGAVDGGEALDPDLAEEEGIALPPEPEPEPAPTPLRVVERAPRERGGPALSPLEQLVARQNVILDQLLQRQDRMARSVESALKTMEGRLKGSDLSHVAAMPRLAVFVDVPNIMFAAERYKVQVDFGRLLDYVSHDRSLIRASAYAPISDDPTQRLDTQRFVEPFVNHGYRIVTKPLKRFADGSIKANFDVELAMDILTMSDRLDIVSLVSGDGDFRRLIDIVASKGVRVEVVSFRQSTSADLIAVADSYIDLTRHLQDLCVPVEGDFRPRQPRAKVDISGYTEGSRLDLF